MITADSNLLVSMQTVADDIVKTATPDLSEKAELRPSRIMSVVLAFSALAIALYIQSAYTILTTIYNFYDAASGIPALVALYWKKATSTGIIASLTGGFLTCALWRAVGPPLGLGPTLLSAAVCFILLVAVSLAPYKKHPHRIA